MRAFRILFACPQTLFDVSNGATMQCYTMLQTLSKLNFQTASIGGGIFDNPSGQARIPNFKEQVSDKSKGEILVNVDSSANPDNPIHNAVVEWKPVVELISITTWFTSFTACGLEISGSISNGRDSSTLLPLHRCLESLKESGLLLFSTFFFLLLFFLCA